MSRDDKYQIAVAVPKEWEPLVRDEAWRHHTSVTGWIRQLILTELIARRYEVISQLSPDDERLMKRACVVIHGMRFYDGEPGYESARDKVMQLIAEVPEDKLNVRLYMEGPL